MSLAPIDRDDLLRWTRAAYGDYGDETARDEFKSCLRAAGELLAVEEEQEARAIAAEAEVEQLREYLLRAWRLLQTDEPANRHPACVNRHRAAVELRGELQPIVYGWRR